MTDRPLRVLVWGSATEGPCAYYRGHQHDETLKALGVEMRHITKLDTKIPSEYRGRAQDAARDGKIEVDTSDFTWSDVLLLRRYYNTSYKCNTTSDEERLNGLNACKFITQDIQEAAAHEHGFREQDGITRWIWPAIRDTYTGGIVYETDDNHHTIQPWNGYYADVLNERPLIEDMARRADIITVATPALIPWYARYGSRERTRVVRNAIDPTLYERDDHPEADHTKPRMVYYGSTARLRDYAGKFAGFAGTPGYSFLAVQALKEKMTRVFMGVNEGSEHIVREIFDEQVPYITGIAAFSKALANIDGDIGIAPLGGDEFDRCKSELHWLEYAMTDMAFIGERFNGRNHPYSVVEHGKDGLLAKGRDEWFRAVKSLVESKQLRDDLAGRAKERVLRDYDYRNGRGEEWKAAFLYAAEHAGIGAGRTPQLSVAAELRAGGVAAAA